MSGPPATAVRVFETPLGRIGVVATARGLARVMLPNQVAPCLAVAGTATGPAAEHPSASPAAVPAAAKRQRGRTVPCLAVAGTATGRGRRGSRPCRPRLNDNRVHAAPFSRRRHGDGARRPFSRPCRPRPNDGAAGGRAAAHAARAEREIRAYLAGRRRTFGVPLDLAGVPPFRRKVLRAARRIPYGATATYAEVARRAGNPRAARAAGQAMAHNPLALVVPCHRVVASGGGLGGFGGGLALKRRLLALEAGRRRGRSP